MEEKNTEITKRTDTEIHNIELLLTLDYLLRFTDEEHPTNQIKICERANDFGLFYKYDKGEVKGNDVRHDRIAKCLKFLFSVSEKYPDAFPFVLQRNEAGKYYIEQRNGLDETQVAAVLAAIKNDKYTKSEDVDFLFDSVLDAFSTSESNKEIIKNEYKQLVRGVRKYNSKTNKKFRLINKAYKENKSILIIQSHFGKLNREDIASKFNGPASKGIFYGTIDEKIRCRVYRIEEHNNKPYAILIPLGKNGIIFDSIENLNIPVELPDRELFSEDNTNKDRLEKLFKENNKTLTRLYDSLDNYVDKSIMPVGKLAFKTSFYFDYRYVDRVQSSFEEYFSINMPVIKCDQFRIDREEVNRGKTIELPHKADKYAIVCYPLQVNRLPNFGVVNIEVNKDAFISWLWNNPEVAKVVHVVSPDSVNTELGNKALELLKKYQDSVGEEKIKRRLIHDKTSSKRTLRNK